MSFVRVSMTQIAMWLSIILEIFSVTAPTPPEEPVAHFAFAERLRGLVTLVRTFVDVASRIPIENDVEVKRVVGLLDTLCRGIPFENEFSGVGGVYGRLMESLARLLSSSAEGHRAAFNAMWGLHARLIPL